VTVVRDVPAPPCPPGSVLVTNAYSVISSGTERSRVELSKKSLLGKARERPDLVREVIARTRREGIRSTGEAVRRQLGQETAVGYSSAGTVIEVGEAVAGFSPGDRVACAGGGHANHAEIVSVPTNLCARVPENVGLEVAAMTTIAAIALHGIRLADVRVGERIAVIGCGLVGQIACRLAQAAGAEVFAIDLDQKRVDTALAHGAHHGAVADAGTADRLLTATRQVGMDAVVITAAAPSNDPLMLATAIARDRGSVVLVGSVPIQMPRPALYDKELSFRVSRSYGPGRYDTEYEERGLDYPIGYVRWTEKRNMEAVLELQARGRLELSDLIDEVVPVERAKDAYARLTGPVTQQPRGALVIRYGNDERQVDAAPVALPAPLSAAAANVRVVAPPVRVALIGPGSFASRILVPALVAAGARLEAVGGGSGPSAEAAQRTLGFARVLDSAEAAAADPEIDAVVIGTRHASHAQLATLALESGKHVFCEKPLALTLDELDRVIEAAAISSGTLAVGFNRRFSPMLRRLKEHITRDGGPIVATYRVSAGTLPDSHWTHDLAEGGGRILGEGCHFVDALSFLAGQVVAVYASGFGAPARPLQARDNVIVTLTFANGSVCSIAYVADGSPSLPKERLEVFSGSRAAVLDDYSTLTLYGPEGQETMKGGKDKGHNAEVAAFLAGVTGGQAPVPLPEIATVSAATLAVVESLRRGCPVRLDGQPN
jgi:predicted dehydrogenase